MSGEGPKERFQARIGGKLRDHLKALIEEKELELIKAGKKSGAETIVLERLLREACHDDLYPESSEASGETPPKQAPPSAGQPTAEDPRLDRLVEAVEELQGELTEVRIDFAKCIATMLVSTKLVDRHVATRWLEQHFRQAGLPEDDQEVDDLKEE